MGVAAAAEMFFEHNWLRRDVLIKRALGFDEAYWRRAHNVRRLGVRESAAHPAA
jgi:hypothetical protein